MNRTTLMTMSDFRKHGGDYLVPRDPVSLYRYIEHLIEIVLPRKHKFETILEIGPGTDSVFKYLSAKDYKQGTILDYSEEIIDFNKDQLKSDKLDYINLDITDVQAAGRIGRTWDYIVSNSFLEHIEDDRTLVKTMNNLLNPGGMIVCSTVLHKKLYNEWDHAVGHYRRYSVEELYNLFSDFDEVEVIQTSMIQELVRPLFFGRIRHLLGNTIEENNRVFGKNHLSFGKPPYAALFPVLKFLMPLYLLLDWTTHRFFGGICFVIAKKRAH